MRTLWTGTLSFGLVTIPVRLVTATEDRSVRFNQLRASDHSRIGYQRVAKRDGEEVDYDEVVKGYEYEPGSYVVFDPEELNALKPESSRTVEIQQFVPLEQIDPIYFDRSYYVAPGSEAGKKAYGLLAQAMQTRDAVAICKITLRDKEHLATLRLRDGVFVLSTMLWPDEVKPVDHAELGVDDLPEPRRQEVAMAEQLIDNLTEDFEPARFSDSYRERVLEAVRAKVEGQEVTAPGPAEEPAPVVDLMEALRQSVAGFEGGGASEQAQPAAAEPGGEAPKGTTKKTTSRKATKKSAKKSAAKSTAKKTGGAQGSTKKAAAKKSASGRRKAS